MNKKNLPIYLSLATIFGVLIGSFFGGESGALSMSNGSKNEAKIKRLLDYIERDYVDNVNTDSLLDDAISQMLGKLDPHSVYISKENMQANRETMQGNFVGIGVEFRVVKDSITVIKPIKGGPSIKAGIKSGDRILMSNNDTLYGRNLSASAIPKYLKGEPGTKVSLEIYRKSNDSLFNIDITRDKVNIKSVDLSYMINEEIGYIKIARFARNTFDEFDEAIKKLKEKGMNHLILDLRGNGGGYVDIATKIVDEFLEDDKLIVFTKNNKGKIQNYYATSKGDFEKGRLSVLIDENSASASEIVAGALQDNDKGTILGRRSFGKGLVQVEMGLGDGSAVRLTTARYYTPTGRSIQKPYSKNGDDSYFRDYQKRMQSGELLSKDSIKVNDSLEYKTPKGKIVYGGGGIIPDVFVAIDTTSYINNFYFRLLMNFSFDYVDNHRKELQKKYTVDNFAEEFDKDDKVYNQLLSKIKDYNPSYKTKEVLKRYLRANIANDLFGDVGYYRVIHQDDKMILKILELESNKE